jgi:predicted secreted protein
MPKFNGTDLLIYVGLPPNNALIAHSTSFVLTIDADLPDATTKDNSGWADHIAGTKNWSIDFEGLVDYSASYGVEELFNNLKNRDKVTIMFIIPTALGANFDYYYGVASCSNLTQTADMEQPVSYSGTLTGDGDFKGAFY